MKQGVGDRMKFNYEEAYKIRMPSRLPVILRLDGKNFHSFTRKMERPFDEKFIDTMAELAKFLCEETHTAQIAYIQSDEISILLHNYKKLDTSPYFANEVQKIASISAGLASSWFTSAYQKQAVFDARVFVLPEAEVVNYFIWRQQDASRNSIAMMAQSKFSPKQLHKKNTNEMQEMMFQKDGMNWNDLPTYKKRGICIFKANDGGWEIDRDIPLFTENRNYIADLLGIEEN